MKYFPVQQDNVVPPSFQRWICFELHGGGTEYYIRRREGESRGTHVFETATPDADRIGERVIEESYEGGKHEE